MGFGSCSGGQYINMQSLRQSKVRKAKSQSPRILDSILTGVDVNALKVVRPVDLKYLGYVFDKTNAPAVTGTGYQLWRILDEDTKREATFCFLLAKKPNVGVVLPHSFTHYLETFGESPTSLDGTPTNEASPTNTTNA
jgi:hypothetical protein